DPSGGAARQISALDGARDRPPPSLRRRLGARPSFPKRRGSPKSRRMRITTVGLDADDTLWHNETIFRLTQERFRALMADVAEPDVLDARLAAVERRNLSLYGYGVKGFTLS